MPTDTKTRQTGPQLLGDRYVLTATTRRGAQATVTQAFDTIASRMVAIKRVRFGPDDERAREGFQREVMMLQGLRHPNIVEMIDVDRNPEGNWYLVMEWVPDNLEDIITREGALSWRHFWERFGQPLLDAIVFAQTKRIAHRDLKPKNILVTETGVPKVADYGIAKLLDQAGAWTPVVGHTFRFDHTPGYTPSEPDQPEYSLSRDCYGRRRADQAVSCGGACRRWVANTGRGKGDSSPGRRGLQSNRVSAQTNRAQEQRLSRGRRARVCWRELRGSAGRVRNRWEIVRRT
jgi:serine/threonine protein kinase